jgi:hypothetical protein
MKLTKSFFLMICMVLVLIPLVSCSPSTGAAAKFPTGKFVNESDPARGMLFNEDGTWAGYLGGIDPVVEGTYSVKGDLYTETSNNDDSEPKCQGPATYKWSFDGTKLTFTLVGEDPCRPRRAAYDSILIRPK